MNTICYFLKVSYRFCLFGEETKGKETLTPTSSSFAYLKSFKNRFWYTLVPEGRYPNKWENIILINENSAVSGTLRRASGHTNREPQFYVSEKSVQELNRVVDWFDKNNNNCDWVVKTAASRGT